MAYYVRHSTASYSDASTTTTGVMPEHESGDYLVAFFSMVNSNDDFGTPPDWTAISNTNIGGSNITVACFELYATSSSETAPVSTHVSEVNRHCSVLVFKDVPTSSAVNAAGTSVSIKGSATSQAAQVDTTDADNCLCLHLIAQPQYRQYQVEPGPMLIEQKWDTDGAHSHGMAWTFQQTAGLIEAFDWKLMSGGTASATIVISITSLDAVVPGRGNIAEPCAIPVFAGRDGGALGYTATDIASTITAIGGVTTNNGNGSTSTNQGAGFNTSMYLQRIASSTNAEQAVKEFDFDAAAYTFLNKKVAFQYRMVTGLLMNRINSFASNGVTVGLRSGTNEYRFYPAGGNDVKTNDLTTLVVDDDTASLAFTGGSTAFDNTDLLAATASVHPISSSGTQLSLDQVAILNPVAVIGGTSAFPATWDTGRAIANSATLNTVQAQGLAIETKQDYKLGGDGKTSFASNGESLSIGTGFTFLAAKVVVDDAGISGDTLKFNGPVTGIEYSISGVTAATRDYNGSVWTGCNFIPGVDVGATTGGTLSMCSQLTDTVFDFSGGWKISGSEDTYDIEISGATAAAIQTKMAQYANCTIGKFHITSTFAGDISINFDNIKATTLFYSSTHGASELTAVMQNGSTVGTATPVTPSDTIDVVAPTFDLDVAVNVSATIRVFTTGTQTQLATATGTTLNWTHGNQTVDITVWAAGYQQQRLTSIDLTDANVTQPFSLIDVPAYDSGHGLTYTTDLTYNRSTKEFDAVTRQIGKNFYSALVDAFNAVSGLHNTDFPIRMDGAVNAIFLNLAYIKAANIDNWYGAGVEYRNASDVSTDEWMSVTSTPSTDWTGATARYQTTAGTGATSARATGSIDEIVKIFKSGAGAFDYRAAWVWKFQVNGFLEARSDLPTLFGVSALEPTEYVIPMIQTAISAATGDPGITAPTFTDSAVVWNSKTFTYTLQSAASGEDILRELNYFLSLAGNWEGESPFNFHNMILEVVAGTSYETQRGIHEGVAGLKGVRVLNGDGNIHPDFTRFQADDGTYYVAPIVNQSTITNLPTTGGYIRLQIVNVTDSSTEIYNADPGSATYSASYTEGGDYTEGDTIRIRFAAMNGATSFTRMETTVTATASGWSVDADNFAVADTYYAADATDGQGQDTNFDADFTNDEIDLAANVNFNSWEAYAFFCYTLTTALGIEQFWGGITAQDGAYRVNVDTINILFDNTTTASKRRLDARRWYLSSGLYPVKDPTTSEFGVDIGNWQVPVSVVTTGGTSLTAPESAKLLGLPSAENIVDEWETQSQADPTGFRVNVKEINEVVIQGDGTEGNPLRAVGVDP